MNHTYIINYLIKHFKLESYLEIGVGNPNDNFNLINCKFKESCDPYDGIDEFDNQHDVSFLTYYMTSDEMFKINNNKYDIIFINGLHEGNQVIRDVYNALQHLNYNGFIVIHDCLPDKYETQLYPRQTSCWTGDVWKAIPTLKKWGLNIHVVDVDWGCGIIRNNTDISNIKLEEYGELDFFEVFKNIHVRNEYLNVISVDEFFKIFNYQYCLTSVCIGDFCGSRYEGIDEPVRREFLDDDYLLYFKGNRMTDDSVCTFAIASALLTDTNWEHHLKMYGRFYDVGYGPMFNKWLWDSSIGPYGSWGNGSAMRVSPIGWWATSEEECIQLAKATCQCSHNSTDAETGAIATALTIYFGKIGKDKEYIKMNVLDKYFPEWKYLTFDTYKEYFKNKGDNTEQFSWHIKAINIVPMCICALLKSSDFVDAIKLVISQGFDTDTAGAIVAPMAYAYYGYIPKKYIDKIHDLMAPENKLIDTMFTSIINER